MVPVRFIWLTQAALLANDTGTFNDGDPVKVKLIKEPFVPGFDTDYSALANPVTAGLTTKTAGAGPQDAYVDPATGTLKMQVKEPAGGWLWIASADPVTPETIYGYCVGNNGLDTYFGGALLDTPVTIDASAQAVHIPEIALTWPSSAPS